MNRSLRLAQKSSNARRRRTDAPHAPQLVFDRLEDRRLLVSSLTDYGDAPATFGTLASVGGAAHVANALVWANLGVGAYTASHSPTGGEPELAFDGSLTTTWASGVFTSGSGE